MENVSKLREIAEALGLKTIITTLSRIEDRINQENAELIIPLVGEFSAGKTSLLNKLINAKLETAVLPTTSVIFEIRFGSKEQKAVIIFNNGDTSETTDIESIKKDKLTNVSCIKIYDTSTKIPMSTVLVDTPGLSSSIPGHQKALIDYLPFADIVLLVVDVNQSSPNKSTLRFIKMAELAKKRIYIVLTKCDSTKFKNDILSVKQDIQKNLQLPVEQVICVSAKDGELDELYALIDTIQNDKNRILEEITALRVNSLKNEMSGIIDDLLDSAELSTEDLDKKIAGKKREMEEAIKNIDSLLSELERIVDRIIDEQVNDFTRRMEHDLEAIMGNLSRDEAAAKQEISNQIKNTANIFFANFKTNVFRKMGALARENRQKSSRWMLPLLASLESFDMSNFNQSEFSYNFNLETADANTINKAIVEGGKAILGIGTMIPDIGPVVKILKGGVEGTDALQQLANLITYEKLVKPQRKRLIENYLKESLLPEFEMQLKNMGNSIIVSIRATLNHTAKEKIDEINFALETLRTEKETLKAEFKHKTDALRKYKKILEAQ